MTTNEQKRNELIETMLQSKWANIYANKLKNKFRNVDDAKGIITSNMFTAIEVYDRNHDLENDEYIKIEKYVFQKAWQISNDAELERLGKKRMGKKKELKQIKVEYQDVMCGKYQDVVKAIDYKDVLSEKDLAIKMIQGRLRSEQELFIKSVLKLGVEQTKQNLGLNTQTFNNRLNRTIRAIEVANKEMKRLGNMNTEFNSLTSNSVDNSISRHDALSESDEIKKAIDEDIEKKLGVRYEYETSY